MKLTPLAPALPREPDGPSWSLIASAVLHALLLLAVLSLAVRPPPMGGATEPSYDLVFQGPGGGSPEVAPNAVKTQPLPPSQPADLTPPPDAVSGVPAPTPVTTPDPAATGSPPPPAESPPPTATASQAAPAPAPAPTPTPAPAQAQAPTEAPSASAPDAVAALPDEPASLPLPTPLEAPPSPQAPAVRLEMPPTDAAPTAAAPIMPEPPPPLPPLEPPQPRPARPPAPRPPRPLLGTLSNPMDLSLAPSSAPRPAARGSVASRSIDLSPPAERQGPVASDAYAQIRAANASADWNRGLLQYWLRHRYYPEQAASDGEEGEVTIQLTVNRSGKVENVEILSRSGSTFLDMAAVGTWRGAQLPPFTNEMRQDRITFPVPIHYYLVRH